MSYNRLTQLLETLRPQLLSQATHIVGDQDDAEDVVQESLLRLLVHRQEWEHYSSLEALCRTVVHHQAIDFLRRTRPRAEIEEADRLLAPSTEDEIEHAEVQALLTSAIDSLPTKQRLIFRLKEVEGYEVEEIARIAGLSPEAIYNNLSRARSALRSRLLMHKDFAPYGTRYK
ncbi:sigma-70 family RNA polymerase sigma factor [uncultured Porphyromonas sp.]|uniref:RNA polymerase sigma factor n=1 Tax=uncultured Porphyromonas sp. TaxID=159274 RepID=UPI00261B1DFD|nr:sigma-70 family RNA polymerase sigma factor [uncultured Porphyromonas sp.]